MLEVTEGFKNIIKILNIDNKKELVNYCKTLCIKKSDLVTLIVSGQHGILDPYKYAVNFMDLVPEHLPPKKSELRYISENGMGPISDRGKKVVRKIYQIFRDRRLYAAHLFYTPCHTYWHLFYFDQRDQEEICNHWIKGPHIHFVNYIINNNEMASVWERARIGDVSFKTKIHIKYIDSRSRKSA